MVSGHTNILLALAAMFITFRALLLRWLLLLPQRSAIASLGATNDISSAALQVP